jgi:hypothetical protein
VRLNFGPHPEAMSAVESELVPADHPCVFGNFVEDVLVIEKRVADHARTDVRQNNQLDSIVENPVCVVPSTIGGLLQHAPWIQRPARAGASDCAAISLEHL